MFVEEVGTGLERFGHIQRIADAYGHERIGVLEDVRLRLLREVLGGVDDAVWRDALDAVRHQLLEDVERETWEQARVERLRTAYRDSFECERVDHEGNEEALFLQDRDAAARQPAGGRRRLGGRPPPRG